MCISNSLAFETLQFARSVKTLAELGERFETGPEFVVSGDCGLFD